MQNLKRIDTNSIPENGPVECRVLVLARNEGQRLPWLLQYYRSLGAARFFIIDNNSDDGSPQELSQQKDCHVFHAAGSFGEAEYGLVWQRAILERYGEKHWWLIADADEQFVYPGSEKIPLPEFCRYLENIAAEAVYTIMIDMYNGGPVSEAYYKPGQPFLDVCPYFDSDYVFRARVRKPLTPKPFPPLEPVGGPRLRHFYPAYLGASRLTVARIKAMRKIRDILRKLGFKLETKYLVPPLLFKVPLLKHGNGVQLINSHRISPVNLAPVTGALLHFKFFSDFHERVAREAQSGEHFDGASEYGRYLKILKSEPNMSFRYKNSARYTSTRQLVELGLIEDTPAFSLWREGQKTSVGLEIQGGSRGSE